MLTPSIQRHPRACLFGSLILATLVGLCIRAGWVRYATLGHLFYDAAHYIRISREGYQDPVLAAFYPLWPLLLRALTWWTSDLATIAVVGGVAAFGLFLGSLVVTWKAFSDRMAPWLVAPLVALYALNPLSIFHALPFSESLCALFLALILWEIGRQAPSLPRLALWTFAAATARPIAAFLPLATILAAPLACWQGPPAERRRVWQVTGTMTLAALAGYVPVGLTSELAFGNFFMPFAAQAFWHRTLGLYWQLLYAPAAVGGSPEVLAWELVAFYGPCVLLMIGLLQLRRVAAAEPRLPLLVRFNFWWSGLFTVGHGATAFLTYPIFMSLARHVLCMPTFFYCLGAVLSQVPETQGRRRGLTAAIVVSALFYLRWWARYAKGSWIG